MKNKLTMREDVVIALFVLGIMFVLIGLFVASAKRAGCEKETYTVVRKGYWDKGAFRQPFWIPERSIERERCKN